MATNGSPRPAFFLAVFVVVAGLVGLGLWRFGALPGSKATKIDTKRDGNADRDGSARFGGHHHRQGIQVRLPAAKLPPVQGISSYKRAVRRPHGALRRERVGRVGAYHLR